MNIADEGTRAHLKVGVEDCVTVSSMRPQSALQVVNECFETWGLPLSIKIDNSYPFVIPHQIDIPTKSKLWWIGLGIKVIQNDLYTPQQNGAVECLQGILCNWSNPKSQDTIEALQKRLDIESDFQRNSYKIPSKGNKTRIELYPSLAKNTRTYTPDKFEMKRVYEFLSLQVWCRRIGKTGTISIFNHTIYIGRRFRGEEVSITFDPLEKQWLIQKGDGTLLKKSTVGIPTEKEIKDFATISENIETTT